MRYIIACALGAVVLLLGQGSQAATISTTDGGSVTLDSFVSLTDSAALSGFADPTGALTFFLFAPGVTPNANDSNDVYTDVVSVNGNGTYDVSFGNNPGGFIPSTAGTFQWLASYSGDQDNDPAATGFGDEPETVVLAASVPEPSSWALLGMGLVGFCVSRRRTLCDGSAGAMSGGGRA